MWFWWIKCMECWHEEHEDIEYVGLNRWICSKCKSQNVRIGFNYKKKPIEIVRCDDDVLEGDINDEIYQSL